MSLVSGGTKTILSSPYLDHYVQCTNLMFKRFLQDRSFSQLALKRPITRTGPTYLKMPTFDTAVLRRKLNEHPEEVVRLLQLQVNENMTSTREIRLGNKGSLAIAKQEHMKGVWYNFETQESGDMMDLVRSVKNINSAQDLESFLVKTILPNLRNCKPEECLEKDLDPKLKMESYVTKVISELQPLEGTVAETYLRKTRKLNILPRNSSLKFHPNLSVKSKAGDWMSRVPGLVATASHPASSTANIQITYLDSRTGDKHQEVSVAKRSFGSFRGHPTGHHSCQLMRNLKKNYSFVCEGVETALSVHQVFPDNHLIATLGKHNLLKLDPVVLNEKVIIILDNDGLQLRRDKVFNATAKRLLDSGKKVFFVLPPLVDGLSKTDMNDVLLHHGDEAVNDVINRELKRITLK